MKYLKDGWLILVLALLFASGLTAVQSALAPKIVQNEKNKTYGRIPMLLLGVKEAEGLTIEKANDDSIEAYRVSKDGEVIGYALKGVGGGYADKITTLVGLSADGTTITGVSVLKQMETPNLGSKITTDWANQYAGKAVDPPLEAIAGAANPADNQIDAITGATISSVCLTTIVNDAVAQFLDVRESLEWVADEQENTDASSEEENQDAE